MTFSLNPSGPKEVLHCLHSYFWTNYSKTEIQMHSKFCIHICSGNHTWESVHKAKACNEKKSISKAWCFFEKKTNFNEFFLPEALKINIITKEQNQGKSYFRIIIGQKREDTAFWNKIDIESSFYCEENPCKYLFHKYIWALFRQTHYRLADFGTGFCICWLLKPL